MFIYKNIFVTNIYKQIFIKKKKVYKTNIYINKNIFINHIHNHIFF